MGLSVSFYPPGLFLMDFFNFLPTLQNSALLTSTFAVAIAEIGDKTQLLSLLLAARFANKKSIILGILVATLLNHAASAWLGVWLNNSLDHWLTSDISQWILAASFLLMALWVLIPDKVDDDIQTGRAWGAFVTATTLFFLAEIGDKTQVATVLLAAEFESVLWVTLGTTLGMLLANVPIVIYGGQLMQRLPLNAARYATSLLFLGLASWIVLA